jgi:glycolate oxidase FAD binding subunit
MVEHNVEAAGASGAQPLDATAAQALAVDGVVPRFVAAPGSIEELGAVLRTAAEQGWAVSPRGAGTKMGLGNPPRALDLMLDLRGLRGLVDYTPADMTVTVRAGTRLADLQAELAVHGQMLALDPPFAEEATIGGILATNDSGPHRLGYGTARDLVIGTRVVGMDGRVTKAGGKVVKNVTGYDLNKLYIGSLGTLAVLAEVSFRLHPLPALARTVWAAFPSAGTAMDAVLRLTRSPLGPVAIMLNDLRGSDMSAGEGRPLRLHVEFTGTPAALARKTDDAQRYCREAGAAETAVLDEGGAAAWTGMREHPRALGTPEGLRLKVAVPVTAVASMLDVVQERARAADLRCWAIAFAGNGIVYVYLDGGTPAPYLSIVHELRGRAVASGGSLVIQECPPALKSLVDVWGEPPSGFGVMKSLKATYDPGHHLNPGRYVGGL